MRKPPVKVSIIGCLIILASIICLIGAIGDLIEYGYYGGSGWQGENKLHILAWGRALGWSLNIVVGYKILMGQNWARLFYMTLNVIGLGIVIFTTKELQPMILQALAVTTVGVCLFSCSAQNYFISS